MSKDNKLQDEEIEKQGQESAPETDNMDAKKQDSEQVTEETDTVDENQEVEEQEVAEEETEEKPKGKKKGIFGMSNKTQELEDELEESKIKLAEMNDKYLRLYSEFDNFRKRTMKEKVELYKTAAENVIVDLLPVNDDFERAIQNIPESEETKIHSEGMLLIYNKLSKLLEKKGVKSIDAMEKDFDTDLHEAITKIPAPSDELKGKVVDVVEKGYTLNEKVIRFAKVVIGE